MPKLLASLLVAFMLLTLLYNAQVPLGEGPDESGHFAYILFLAREGRLPVQQAATPASDVPGEGHQPPLAYLLALPALTWLPADQRSIILSANPAFIWSGGDSPAAFVRGSRERWPWQGPILAWHLARAISGLWAALAVVFTYLTAQRLQTLDSERTQMDDSLSPTIYHPSAITFPLLAAALIAFNPQFLFTSALVTNDALLAALGAAMLWLCLGPPLSVARALLLGLLFGAALLTKQSALLFGPLLLWASWHSSRGNLRRLIILALIWGCGALLVAGWWYIRNWQLYGDPLGLAIFRAEFITQPFVWRDPAAWWGAVAQLYSSFWARFGWMSLRPPGWLIWPYSAITIVAVLGWLRRPPALHGQSSIMRSPWFGVALLAATALAWTLSFALTAGLVAWQGRMLFPAVSAIGLLLAHGLHKAIGEKQRTKTDRILLYLLPLGFCLALYLPFAVIGPAYEWRVLRPSIALSELGQPTYARYARSWKRGVELRGWRLEQQPRVGQDLALALTWHALEPIPVDWTVFVHLVDGVDQLVAESNSKPQRGAFPMPRWTAGDWVADQHNLALPADVPPGRYRLRVGLYRADDDDQEREAAWAADGTRLGDYAELGIIEIP